MTEKIAGPISLDLNGGVVLLTGASAGLGARFAQALSAAGARLVLTARRAERLHTLAKDLPGQAIVVAGDVADAAHREAAVAAALEHYGRLDGVVSNAAAADVGPALHQTTDRFRSLVEVDLVAPYALMVEAARAMRAHDIQGSLVVISSIIGIIPVSWQPHAGYAAAKSGLIGLTRELASQWGRYGIRVNSIAPGPFVTEMSGDTYESGWTADRMRAAVPLGRIGREGEIDALLTLLLHPASSYLTGQTIAVDGGMSAAL